ncbi:Nitrate reductase [NADH] [Sesamum angolense]|uniref:nitrate reductase (NADH) n=1 Tax=Sesamum angolense TaxID=2727404 RepID=A0AAE1WJE4_9LAMI|nr:Nitrate reductase [NADH] [Sesamum angolense]
MRLTMHQLETEFPSREFPVTLVCAGNRRKEQNMVKQTIGFNWGAAGISTSVWRGVPLRAILKRCGIMGKKKGALNVCFEGAEDLPGGRIQIWTSVKKEIAMDPARDIILAYMQNGERLTPDHGFPVRVIIPGCIGGRMVKWLKRIIVTTQESDNYYHYKDNRVLQSHVDAELANAEAWWYKPQYIINELNINSVITTPCHEEILPINSWTTQRPYTLRGYAYSGSGKKVTRVEVTLDGGETWHVCALDISEKPNKYGKYWCWCFWSLEVEVLDLLGAKEIAVRAWDETLNTQPEKLIWNAMGMMNNCWFRVKTNVCKPHKGEIGIVFEHPTQPGNQYGGWMAKERHLEKSSSENQTLKKSVSSPFMNTTSKTFSISEVKKHNSPDSAWIIVHGHIYDCTRFLKDHPGGTDSIIINAGTDCTEEFDAIHSDKAKKMLEDYRIGELITTGYASADSSPNNSVHGLSSNLHLAPIKEVSPTMRSIALVPREKIPCKLIAKTSLSHHVRLFRFALSNEDQVLGLPVGKHIFLCTTIDDKLCMRAYTPSSTVDTMGYFELVVKIYLKGVHPKFPNGGQMSQYLDSLELGSLVGVKGPLGHIEYNGKGYFTVYGKQKFAKKLAMIAGGTGITPIYQVMQAILKDPEDDTEMYLVYANRTEDDILLNDELDAWAEKYPDKVKVCSVVRLSRLLVGLPILRLVMDSNFDCLGSSLALTKEDQSGLVFSHRDRDRVLEHCPYAFDKTLLVLAPVEAEDDPNLMDLNWCKFHIHIHGLPLGKITQEIDVFIGNRLEKFKEVDLDRNGEVLGSSICIWVALDITKPFKRALKLHTVLGDDHLIFFTYERLQNFCYLCGCLGTSCGVSFNFKRAFVTPGEYTLWTISRSTSLNSHGRNCGFPTRGNANAPLCTIFMTCSSLQSQVPTATPSRGPSIFGELGNAQLGNTTSALPPLHTLSSSPTPQQNASSYHSPRSPITDLNLPPTTIDPSPLDNQPSQSIRVIPLPHPLLIDSYLSGSYPTSKIPASLFYSLKVLHYLHCPISYKTYQPFKSTSPPLFLNENPSVVSQKHYVLQALFGG